MFSVENHSGRLIETRTSSLATLDEVSQFGARFREVAQANDDRRVVICGDYRGMRILAPEVAEKFVAMLMVNNPRIERSAVLCAADHPTSGLQLERTVRQAGNPSRRTFRDPAELTAWLGEVLTMEERTRLAMFLAR